MKARLSLLLSLAACLLPPCVLAQGREAGEPRSVTAPSSAEPAALDLLLGLLGDFELVITHELIDLVTKIEGRETVCERLRKIATDITRKRYLRVRATGALAFFPSSTTRDLLEDLVLRADDPEVRIQAVVALGHGFWSIDRAWVRSWLERIMDHPDQGLSQAAARTLGRLLPRTTTDEQGSPPATDGTRPSSLRP